ncbi:hypothetical protein Tco_1144878 [Tanacetum coccineum]
MGFIVTKSRIDFVDLLDLAVVDGCDGCQLLNDHESNKSQYFNVVKDDYKPCLASVFSNVKPKRKKRGFERNYVLRSVKERKRRLAMSLDSLYGQQARCVWSAKIRSINELMTLEVFVEQLLRPHNFKKEKVTLPDGFAKFIKMQDPPEYQFPWGYRDIVVTRASWLGLACLDLAKDVWLHDSHLDLWVDLMWYFREPDADWAMVSSGVVRCVFPDNQLKEALVSSLSFISLLELLRFMIVLVMSAEIGYHGDEQ